MGIGIFKLEDRINALDYPVFLLCLYQLKGQDVVLNNAMRPLNNFGLNIGKVQQLLLSMNV